MKKLLVLSFFMVLIFCISARAEIATNKTEYRPGETVEIGFNYSETLFDVKLAIGGPGGSLETPKPVQMKNVTPNAWAYNHTLRTGAANGTYVINISANLGGTLINASTPMLKLNKTFDVIAWRINASLNKYAFKPKETLNLTFLIWDRYSDKLKFSVTYSIKDSLGVAIKDERFSITEANMGFIDTLEMPENYKLGVSTIKITLADSDNRNSEVKINFTVSGALNETRRTAEKSSINIENYSFVIWYFAIGIVIAIILITIIKYRKIRKKKKEEKRELQKQQEKKEQPYFKRQEEYRTEYY